MHLTRRSAPLPATLSQSSVGLSGSEPLVGDSSGVLKIETFLYPQSGNISAAWKFRVQNHGWALTAQSTKLGSSIAGQLVQQSLVGVSYPTYGSLTFARQNTLLEDGVVKYDPQRASQGFSLIGLSGSTAGAGDTEDRRLDSSLKYIGNFSGFRLGTEYKFNGASGSAHTASQIQVGYEILQVYWAGVRWSVGPNFERVGAYYRYKQNSYPTSANAGCLQHQSRQLQWH